MMVGTAVLTGAVGLARADDEQVLHDETLRGPVWSQTGGGWKPVDAAVTLRCTSDEPPGDGNGHRVACWHAGEPIVVESFDREEVRAR